MTPAHPSVTPPAQGSDLSSRTLLLAILLALTCFYGNLARESYTDDFRAFYLASVVTHDHLDPYINQVNVSEKYADALWLRVDSRFIYPPTSLIFFAPLRLLPYKWSKTAFGLLVTLAMVAILMGLERRFPRQKFVLLVLFLTLPMFMTIDNGNCDAMILAFVLASFYLEDGLGAGVCLGVAIGIKFAPVLAILWFVTARRWRTIGWSLATVGLLSAAAWLHYGGQYFPEFLTHLLHHEDKGLPVLNHTFLTVHKIANEVLVTTDGVFAYQHDVGGYMQNPLRFLHLAGTALGIAAMDAFLIWVALSRRGRRLTPEQSFFLFLVLSLLANPLLWAMGLVACFPLIVLLVDSSLRPNRTAALLLVPMLLTRQIVGEQNFLIWLICAGFCLWQSGWLRTRPTALSS